MCGRYSLFNDKEIVDIAQIIQEVESRYGTAVNTGEIYPTNLAPVLIGGDVHPEPARWGFPKFNGSGVIINVNGEVIGLVMQDYGNEDQPIDPPLRRADNGLLRMGQGQTQAPVQPAGYAGAVAGRAIQRFCGRTSICHSNHGRERLHAGRSRPDAGHSVGGRFVRLDF